MNISIDAEKAFDKFSKNYKSRYRGNIFQHKKDIYDKHRANIILYGEKLKTFLLYSGTRQRCPLSFLLFNMVLAVLTTTIRQKKEEKVFRLEEK